MAEPERLGRYTLGTKLGEGGIGVVYRAVADGAEGFSKAVAIKRIHGSLARDPGIREMFVTEARTAQRLKHGNIVQIIDVGSDDGSPYLVIELVEGTSLAAVMQARRGPLPAADALYIAENVASALAYAHGLADRAGRPDGVVHRDVTPRNILISSDGVVKLADFGIAKALAAPSYTLPGTFKGSLGYLAPEQARGDAIDARADQFAFGIVLYEMLAGTNPVGSRDIESYAATLARGVPPLTPTPPIDAALVSIVARATALEPAARYPSMNELRAELEAWRVTHKLRTSNESLRDTLRHVLGEDTTVPGGRALGDLLDERGATATRHQTARPPARSRGRAPLLVALGTIAIGAAVAVLVTRKAPGSAAAVDAGFPVTDATARAEDAKLSLDASPPPADAALPDAGGTPRAAARKKGLVKIMVVPWASVTIDGKSLGGVPVNVELTEGPHRLILENADLGQRVEKQIRVVPGSVVEVSTW